MAKPRRERPENKSMATPALHTGAGTLPSLVAALKDRERQAAHWPAGADADETARIYTAQGRATYGRLLEGIIRVGGLVPPG
jgi:hypothetical protein